MISPRVEFAFTHLPRRIALCVGSLLVALAAVVMFGWFSSSAALIQVLPGAPPMRFITAVCLGLLGLALIAIGRRSHWLPRILGGAIATFALATLCQDVAGFNIAINTALCCVLAGLACISLGASRCSRWQPLLECACGALVVAIGAVSTFGYLSGLEAAYGWGGSMGMSVHTAIALTLTGLAIMVLAVGHEYERSSSMPRWLPLPAIIVQLAATIAIAQALCLEELKKSDQARQDRVNCVARLLEQQLTLRPQSFEALANRLAEVVPADLIKGFALQIEAAALPQTTGRNRFPGAVRTSEALLAVDGLELRVSLSQPWSFAAVLRRPIPIALIVRSLLMAVILGLAIYFAQRSLERSVAAQELAAELRRTEARVRTSEQRLELAIRGSSDGIWDWNLATGETYYSPRYKQLLGYRDDEFANDLATFNEHLHPDDASATRAALEANLERGEPFDATFRLRTKSGEWRWFRSRGDAVRAADGCAERMAGAMTDVTEAVLAERELTRGARLDKLTGLPNRLLLVERLQHTIDRAHAAQDPSYAVMFLDFDRFKLVNDSLGHDVGDVLLQAIAGRLKANIGTVDSVSRRVRGNSVGRLGGDEFVVLLDDLQCAEEALALADRLLAAFAEPYQLGEHEVYSTASIGIVIGHLCYDQAPDALRDADVAMYEAKQTGKARYVVFDESMRQAAQRHLQLEHDLHKAVTGEQLSFAFEPQLSLVTGELLGVEAVVRWKHPIDGDIDPAEFLPIAEESDLIHPLGAWALSEACRQMREWMDELGDCAPPVISLNVSRKQFARRDFVELVRRTLAQTGLPADRLQLEVGEDVLTGDVDQALRTMEQLRELRVKLAVDDFGAGNGSFALLHRLPIQMLKVDRSLLADIESSKHVASLLHALAVLVRNLGITLVASGVHRRGQWLALQELGCLAAQGPFIAARMTAEEIVQFVVGDSSVALTASGALAFAQRLSETMSLEAI